MKRRSISIVSFKGIVSNKNCLSFLPFVPLFILFFDSFATILGCSYSQHFQRFPDIGLPDRPFGDITFKELPICNIRVSKNNTIVSVTDHKGKVFAINSCGKEGYKNCRKGTNIAGQATAITLSKVHIEENITCDHILLRKMHKNSENNSIVISACSSERHPHCQSCRERSRTRQSFVGERTTNGRPKHSFRNRCNTSIRQPTTATKGQTSLRKSCYAS